MWGIAILCRRSQCPTVAAHGTQWFSICLAALPFKPVKLTSESDHESQSLLGPKGVTGQVVETHIQSPVTSESSDQQKEVLDAKDIGPRQKELPVSEKVNKPKRKLLLT